MLWQCTGYKMAKQYLMWVQAVVTVALTIFRVLEGPSGRATDACVTFAGISCGILLGWHGREYHENRLNGLSPDYLAFFPILIQTVGVTVTAVSWVVGAPSRPETAFLCALAGFNCGVILGYLERGMHT